MYTYTASSPEKVMKISRLSSKKNSPTRNMHLMTHSGSRHIGGEGLDRANTIIK